MTTAPIVLVVRVWEVAPWEAAAMNVGATGAAAGAAAVGRDSGHDRNVGDPQPGDATHGQGLRVHHGVRS
jgi:hypothetical protein